MKNCFILILSLLVILPGYSKERNVDQLMFENCIIAEGITTIEGKTCSGAYYSLSKPHNWNGDLVIYCHEYVNPALPVMLPDISDLETAILADGYGIAYSSYSENGWVIKDALKSTRKLIKLYRKHFSKPEYIYMIGHSMGGMIPIIMAEKRNPVIDGGLSICSLTGGSKLEIEYLHNMRILFEYYFPDIIPGDITSVPEGMDYYNEVAPLIIEAISEDPGAALEFTMIDQLEISFTTEQEFAAAFLAPLYFYSIGINDLTERAHGHPVHDNTDTVYTIDQFPIPYLNDPDTGVIRIRSTPRAEKFVNRWYNPTGNLKVPIITFHATRDPIVPFSHQRVFNEIVGSAGKSDLLVQHTFDRSGHVTTITTEEQYYGFLELVAWVENGTAPFERFIP